SNNVIKRKAILNYLKKEKVQVVFLQQIHLNEEEHKKYLREWVGQIYFTSYSSNTRGAIILVHKLLPFTAQDIYKDTDGRIVLVKGELSGELVLLGNVDAPNVYDDIFLAFLLNKIVEMDCANMITGGDFNCYLSPSLDRDPPHRDQSKAGRALQNFLKVFNLLDGWRYMNPNNKNYTLYSSSHLSLSRIDYILVSEHLVHLVEQSSIGPIALSDHAPVTLEKN
uniref:exodeoxyribonuclease III n=1 Tax=Acanthochromis polyacanthus TaxID=80966 RepID=A0A3Q1GBC0_9TELE